ncbi:PFL_4669 family integrating conjugative element protein [Pseudomonas synxantha]|uniref:Integrating conjugative element protein (TIGR03761 family) n=1 Tax=Pseudomonas synxantha TaxID=47883 RepID=A0ACC6JW17_9PSED|nr:TIGR03761 family integrating conjugative element protein [Pseudomonas synxantha]MDR6610540.1 integrating conjugative element protein (TIGR03761 family) [Pseudomonas synxantha]
MANDLQLNLGALRSAMQLTLHTHHASRIWHGRAPSEGRATIVGLNGFVSIMNKMKRGAEQDDPYSDVWMLRIEDKLTETRESLKTLREQVDQVLAEVPSALSLGENLNVQPVNLPLFVNAQLGFMAVYLLADYDDLARRLILAHHTALIDRSTLERWLNEGAHALRSLFSLAQQYKFSGVQREDFAANNAAARMAREKFGEVPEEILEGTRRSRFAPPMTRRVPINGQQAHEEALADDTSNQRSDAINDAADAPCTGYSSSEEEEHR